MAKNNDNTSDTVHNPRSSKMKKKFEDPLVLGYLIKILKPLSEADPALVANYIVALLKNDKPKEELQKICVEELNELLGENTTTFVAQLFQALEDGRSLAFEEDTESRKLVDASTAVAHGDSTEVSSSRQHERLSSVVAGAFPDHEEQEGSNDEDDDRNHKHTRRAIESSSLNWDIHELEKGVGRKRGRPAINVQFVPQSETETSKSLRESIPSRTDAETSIKYSKIRHGSTFTFASRLNVDGDHRRGSQVMYNQAVGPIFDLNGCVHHRTLGRARGINTGQWPPHDSRFMYESVDFSAAIPPFRPPGTSLYPGRSILNQGNPTNPSWVAFRPMPGMPSGVLNQPHLLHTGLQGGRGLSLSNTLHIGVGIGRPRCRDFEERGFCLRGDMCPMEHGTNRIVVDDVQSLSQFNLSIPIPSRQLESKGASSSNGPSAGSARKNSHDKNIGYRSNREATHLNSFPTIAAGIEEDLYDPDQPLLNNAHPERSYGLRQNSPNTKREDAQLQDGSLPGRYGNDIPDTDDNIGSQICVASSGLSHNVYPSVWDRIGPLGYAYNRPEEDVRVADGSNEALRNRKRTKAELCDDQDSYNRTEERDVKNDSDQDSGSKDINIHLRRRKVMGTSKSGAPKIASLSGQVSCKDVVRRSSKRGGEKAQRTLFVSCIPTTSNRVESLLSHFQKFGEVLGVHIPPNSDKAFVQFSCREEAEAALSSPDAVLGNRFIKLAWAHWDSAAKQEKIGARLVPSGTTSNALSVALPASQVLKKKISNIIPFSPPVSRSEEPKSDSISAKPVPTTDVMPKTISALHKQEALETLKLIREKQEILDQKREDFRRRLDKITKQGIISRGDALEKTRASKHQKTEDIIMLSNKSCSSANLEQVSETVLRTGNDQGGSNDTSMTHPKEL